jgi:hypothetical protein
MTNVRLPEGCSTIGVNRTIVGEAASASLKRLGATRGQHNPPRPAETRARRRAKRPLESSPHRTRPKLRAASLDPKVEGSNPSRPISERPAKSRNGGARPSLSHRSERRGHRRVRDTNRRAAGLPGRAGRGREQASSGLLLVHHPGWAAAERRRALQNRAGMRR